MASLFNDPKALGEALRTARRAAELSQAALGRLTGTSKTTVYRWENGIESEEGGKSPDERRSIAAKVAEATGASRQSLGLSPLPLEDEAEDELGSLRARQTRLLTGLDRARSEIEDLRKRLGRVERIQARRRK